MTTTTEERFWNNVNLLAPGGCWTWTGGTVINGYGRFHMGGRSFPAHRWAWRNLVGPISEGLELDHIACSRDCVNPAHLRLTTRKQNMENQRRAHKNSKSGVRGVSPLKGRWAANVRHHGRQIYLGSFDTIAEAQAVVVAKRLELFTHNDADRIKVVQ